MSKRTFYIFLSFALVFFNAKIFAQAPNISYATSQPAPYPVGTAITTLTPTNTGGTTVAGYYTYNTFVTLATTAYGVATDAFSNVYTVDFTNKNLQKYNSGGTGGIINSTSFAGPDILTIDGLGNIYVSDFTAGTVLKFNSSGTLLATISGFTNSPYGLTTDASNNLYISDLNTTSFTGNIIKVAAGTTTKTTLLTGITGGPYGLATVGNDLYISQYNTGGILKIANALTGSTTQTAFASGFNGPRNITSDASGNIYVADFGNNAIKKVTPAGVVSPSLTGLNAPRDVTFDASGIMYVANGGANTIIQSTIGSYSISPFTLPPGLSFDVTTGNISGTPTAVVAPTVYTITAGNGTGTSSTTITISTTVAAPSLSYSPTTYTLGLNNLMTPLAPTNSGGAVPANVYGTVSLFAGSTAGTAGTGNGTGTGASFNTPTGVNVTNTGTIYVADKGNQAIRALTPAAASSTYAGTIGTAGRSNTGTGTFSSPSDVTSDLSGNLFVADFANNEIRKIASGPVVSLLAGATGGGAGSTNGAGSLASFSGPNGSVYDPTTGAVYIADLTNKLIRKVIVSSGLTSTFGTGITYNAPASVAVDASGNVYVADKGLNKIIKITSGGTASVFAGSGTAGTADGTGIAATFKGPDGITVDKSGNIYVSDGGGNKIRMITLAGVVTTIAGSGTAGRNNAVGILASFNAPAGLDVDPTTGNIFIADATSNEIRQITGTGFSISPTTLPAGLSFDSTTGTISGTPTANTSATTYTITGFNAGGASAATVTISVSLLVPGISYTSPVSYAASTAITSPALSNSAGTVGTFAYNNTPTQPLTGTTFSGPERIATDASGNIYVLNTTGNTIREFSSTGALVTATWGTGAPAFAAPVGMVFDSGGNAYVLNATGSKIYKYNSSAAYQSTITLTGATTTTGLAIDASNNLYITNYSGTSTGSYAVFKYSGSTQTTIAGIATPNITQPCNITIDPSGNIFVLNLTGTNSITKFTSAGAFSANFATGYSAPQGLWSDDAGNIYGADKGNSKIFVYAPAGGTAIATITSASNGFYSGATDAAGNTFVTDFTNSKVYKYTPTGGYFLTSPLPSGLLISSTTGAISGTTTATSSPATNYTVTAWNTAGSGSTAINITVYNTFQWVGNGSGTKSDWKDGTNWNGGVVPTSADQAQIGVAAAAVVTMPIIPATVTVNVGSIVMGTSGTTVVNPTITVNGTGILNVTGDITFKSTNTGASTTARTAQFASTTTGGTINAYNLNVTSNSGTGAYTQTLTSSVTTLNLTGDLIVTTAKNTGVQNATFNLTSGTMTTDGINTTNGTGTTTTVSVSSGTTLQFTGATAFAGLSATGTNSFTIAPTTLGYTGNNDQIVYTDAAISNSSLTSGISYTNIAFSGTTGIKTALSSNLNVSGNFTNSLVSNATDTYVDLSTPTVKFTGTTQALAGGTGLGTAFYNVAFSGAGTKTMSGTFTLESTGILTMTGTSSTILNAGSGSFTLKSDANSSATIAALSGPIINGTVNVQRFVTGGSGMRGYRTLSSPVYASAVSPNNVYSLNYIANSAYLTGATITAGGIDKVGNPSLWLFRENVTPNSQSFVSGNFRGVSSMGTGGTSNVAYTMAIDGTGFNVPVGNGFLFFFRGDRNAGTLAAETVTTYIPTNTTFTATGTLNQGNITVHHWYSPSSANLMFTSTAGNSSIQGYNLVGNPYASSISWTSVYAASTNVGVSIYEFNPVTNQYGAYVEGSVGGTGGFTDIIASGQGFFTIAANSTASLNFTEATKVSSQPATLLMGIPIGGVAAPQYMHLKMIKDSINYDDVIIGFKPNADTKYSIHEDGLHLTGNSPPETLATLSSDSVNLSVNYLPLPKAGKSQTIGLNVNATATGIYTFSKTEFVGIPNLYQVWLKDNLLKDSLDLRANSTYSFKIDKADATTFGSGRFQIVLRENPALGLHLLDFGADKITGVTKPQVQITWKVENEANYTTFYVQRSTDGGATFQSIGSLQSDGSGNYFFVDKSPVATGQNQYRLQLSDADNTLTYSSIITVEYAPLSNTVSALISLYPNPVHDVVNITVSGVATTSNSYTITLTNSSGVVVKTTTSSQVTWQNNISNLLPGTYFIQVVDNNSKAVVGKSKFVKL